jgi:hypothetical protein
VEGVGNQGDDNVDLGDLSVEGIGVVDIELPLLVLRCASMRRCPHAYGVGVGNALGEVLCLLECPARYGNLDTRLCEDVDGWSCAVVVSLK